MNKQEAKQKLHNLAFVKMNAKPDDLKLADVMQVIAQIDEPQKVVVPKFVAVWAENTKKQNFSLRQALEHWSMSEELEKWFQYSYNQDTFARAWMGGYEVEQEKRYVVTDGNKLYLKEFDELNAVIIIDDVVGATDYAKRYSDINEAQKAAADLGWKVEEVK